MGGMAHPIASRFGGLCQLELNRGSNVVEIYGNIACELGIAKCVQLTRVSLLGSWVL